MSGLREQTTEPARDVAAVIREHRDLSHLTLMPEWARCSCGWAERDGDYAEHVAAAVIAALGLTEEIAEGINVGDEPERESFSERRWVSGWSVVDGDPK